MLTFEPFPTHPNYMMIIIPTLLQIMRLRGEVAEKVFKQVR